MTAPEEIVAAARSLFDRDYTFGIAGNMSVRAGGRVFITPTNSSFEKLTPEALAEVGLAQPHPQQRCASTSRRPGDTLAAPHP